MKKLMDLVQELYPKKDMSIIVELSKYVHANFSLPVNNMLVMPSGVNLEKFRNSALILPLGLEKMQIAYYSHHPYNAIVIANGDRQNGDECLPYEEFSGRLVFVRNQFRETSSVNINGHIAFMINFADCALISNEKFF